MSEAIKVKRVNSAIARSRADGTEEIVHEELAMMHWSEYEAMQAELAKAQKKAELAEQTNKNFYAEYKRVEAARTDDIAKAQARIKELENVIKGKTFYCVGCAGEVETLRARIKELEEALKAEIVYRDQRIRECEQLRQELARWKRGMLMWQDAAQQEVRKAQDAELRVIKLEAEIKDLKDLHDDCQAESMLHD